MLVLSRKPNESIIIGDNIEIKIVEVKGDYVKLGITAPKSIPVHRKEVYEAIQRENIEAAQSKVSDIDKLGDLLAQDGVLPKTDRKEDTSKKKGKNQDENKLSKLRRIAQAIGAHLFTTHSGEKRAERIGYVQGFNFIIAYLMTLTHDESDIFVLFVGLMERKQVQYLQPQDLTQEDIVSRKVDYGISGLYSGDLERVYNLHYIVRSLIEMYYKDLHNHLEKYSDEGLNMGIETALSMKLFCVGLFNVQDSSVMTTMFEKIVYGGYYAVIRLTLSTYIAYKEEIKMLNE